MSVSRPRQSVARLVPNAGNDKALTPKKMPPVHPAPPSLAAICTINPVITTPAGPQVGVTLNCSDGSWKGTAPITFVYQWLRDGAVINLATAAAYTLIPADSGTTISCRVTGTNGAGNSQALSNQVRIP